MSSEWREQSKSFSEQAFHFEYATLHDLIMRARGKKFALIVALDHVTDIGNFGALIRSAEVIGATGVLIPNRRAAQVNEAVFRASAGAVEHLPIARESNLAQSLARLKEEDFWVCAATEHARDDIWHSPLEGRIVLVMGAEDTGVSRLVSELCDFECRLPQFGKTQSLNVAQACTAILYEWRRRTQNAS
jgi:23S rRNA (guanosine2251-2'-O)-methyltransferase